jgi:hypothetical protein
MWCSVRGSGSTLSTQRAHHMGSRASGVTSYILNLEMDVPISQLLESISNGGHMSKKPMVICITFKKLKDIFVKFHYGHEYVHTLIVPFLWVPQDVRAQAFFAGLSFLPLHAPRYSLTSTEQ